MARLCGIPAVSRILDLLCEHGITQAALTLRYLPNVLREEFPGGEYKGIKLDFVMELEPLGTAGGVKNAVPQSDGSIVVISGDALCDVDLTAAIKKHNELGADATLVVTRVADPREYGLVRFGGDGLVTGFLEKPGWNQAVTNAANTGIYILSPTALALIPENKPFDFAKDLFPLMMKEGKRLAAYETFDYWCDIGDLLTYRLAQADILHGRVSAALPPRREGVAPNEGIYFKDAAVAGDFQIIPPVYFGSGVSVGKGAVIGPDTILDDNVTVGEFSRVRQSVLLPGAFVGERARLTGAVVGAGASVKSEASVYEDAALGAGAIAGLRAEILPGVLIWPGKEVPDNARQSDSLQYGAGHRELFDDDGISGETGVDLTPELCAKIGAAVGSLRCGRRVGVAYGGSRAAKAFKAAFCAGVLSTGAQVWDFGEAMEAETAYAASFCSLSLCVHIGGGGGAHSTIRLIGENGLPANRNVERELAGIISRGQFSRASWNGYRDVADMTGIRMLYRQELYKSAPKGLSGCEGQARCGNREGERVFEDTLIRLGCDVTAGPVFNLSPSGTKVSVTDKEAGHITHERILAAACLIELRRGHNLTLPYDAPRVIDALAEKYGKSTQRYFSSSADGRDKAAREKSRAQLWLRDGMMTAIRLLSYLRESEETLVELMEEIPAFATAVRSFEIDVPPTEMFEKISGEFDLSGEGALLSRNGGTLLIRPSKKGKSLRILAEAASSETAEALCDEICAKLESR
jgi:mannose-1-phosphate guanylyltransferase/phosphomannomutase